MASPARGSLPYEVERISRTIFKRCILCGTDTPTCPDCPNGQICSLVPPDCNTCAHMVCIANPSPAPDSSGPNVGAIAGGVVGGVVFMAAIMFFLWRFWIKKRREQQEMEAEWIEDEIAQSKGRQSQFTNMRQDAASTRSRGSIANTILSRASNIIQIAYIPGVTNRNGSGHNSMLANTPVPPIPAQYKAQSTTPNSPLSNEGDVLFFRPGSLRGSTYSDGSSMRSGNRDTQYTRQSITPSLARSSMMSGMSSDVYMDDASAEPMPAATVLRGLPRMVSVKGSPATSPSEGLRGTSPNPNGVKVSVIGQNSTSSSPRGNASFAKATQVTVGKGKGRFPVVRQPSDSSVPKHTPSVPSPLMETATDSDDEDEHARARRSLIQATARAADPAPLIQPLESPFFDASELQTSASASAAARPNPYAAMSANVSNGRARRANSRGPGGLSAVIEEAAKRASQDPEHEAAKKDVSPFSDAHATS